MSDVPYAQSLINPSILLRRTPMEITYRPARHLVLYLLSSVLLAVSVMAGSILIEEYVHATKRPIAVAGASEVYAPEAAILFTGK